MTSFLHALQGHGEKLWWIGVLTPLFLMAAFVWGTYHIVFVSTEALSIRDWIVTIVLVPGAVLFCAALISGRIRTARGLSSRASSSHSYLFSSAFGIVWLFNIIGLIWVGIIGCYALVQIASLIGAA